MNNKIDIINEQLGNFIMAPTIPPPPISVPPVNNTPSNNLINNNQQYTIDNALLYKKLIDIENELKYLKGIINSLNYPRHTYYSTQPFYQPPLMTPQNQYHNL